MHVLQCMVWQTILFKLNKKKTYQPNPNIFLLQLETWIFTFKFLLRVPTELTQCVRVSSSEPMICHQCVRSLYWTLTELMPCVRSEQHWTRRLSPVCVELLLSLHSVFECAALNWLSATNVFGAPTELTLCQNKSYGAFQLAATSQGFTVVSYACLLRASRLKVDSC